MTLFLTSSSNVSAPVGQCLTQSSAASCRPSASGPSSGTPNLYADLSANSALRALRRDSRHAVEFLETHREKLLFGRDIYGTALRDFLATLDLAAETVESISHRNARRLVPV